MCLNILRCVLNMMDSWPIIVIVSKTLIRVWVRRDKFQDILRYSQLTWIFPQSYFVDTKFFSVIPFSLLSLKPILDNIVRQCVGFSSSGSEGNMKHGLTGYLAGLSVLVGALESPRVLSCLTRCQESLDTPAMELLQPSMELLTNNGMDLVWVCCHGCFVGQLSFSGYRSLFIL